MARHHFVLLSFPAQGHINPNLQLSKRLLRVGVRVTFLTSAYARLRVKPLEGLTFAEYDDGYDGDFKKGAEARDQMVARMRRCSSEALRRIVSSAAEEGCPVTCIAYSLLLPWAAAVARDLRLPSALIWIQAATMFDIYYYYYHGFDGVIHELESESELGSASESDDDEKHASAATVGLPGIPLRFTKRDLPSGLFPKKGQVAGHDVFHEHMAELDAGTSPVRVLVNTFDALESEALKSVSKLKLTAVGPLIPSALLDGRDPSDTHFGGDLFQTNDSCVEWLDSKAHASVIYVSFGSISFLPKLQMEEIGRGLLDMGKPFLWVIRDYQNKTEKKAVGGGDDQLIISCMDELERLGLVVPWCSQLQVLSHPAISCFFTHCGWNSVIESLVCSVPMVGFPQLFDQSTNAKLVEDYWKIGARVNPNGDGFVERGEIKRCLELVMGDTEMRQNAKKWQKLSVEAVKEGWSSDKNLQDFVYEVAES
uniref:Glycosyltransferase n=1 Tax=Kalanchoe fedtschenkoi TaxID=63787 RepID=A0A7N0ZWZ1_KALFE